MFDTVTPSDYDMRDAPTGPEGLSLSLQSFTLDELAIYTREGEFASGDSPDFRTFYVGRDDVHSILMFLLTRVTVSMKFSMFGFADESLAEEMTKLIVSDHVYVQGTLDKSQSFGTGEAKIIAAMPDAVRSSFAIGDTPTGQIEHTKGATLDGLVAFEGSTNWSASGEGTGIGLHGASNTVGYKAQANTLTVYTNQIEIQKFASRLDEEHTAILQKQVKP